MIHDDEPWKKRHFPITWHWSAEMSPLCSTAIITVVDTTLSVKCCYWWARLDEVYKYRTTICRRTKWKTNSSSFLFAFLRNVFTQCSSLFLAFLSRVGLTCYFVSHAEQHVLKVSWLASWLASSCIYMWPIHHYSSVNDKMQKNNNK